MQSEIMEKLSLIKKENACISASTEKKINWSLYIFDVVFHFSLQFKSSSFFSLT